MMMAQQRAARRKCHAWWLAADRNENCRGAVVRLFICAGGEWFLLAGSSLTKAGCRQAGGERLPHHRWRDLLGCQFRSPGLLSLCFSRQEVFDGWFASRLGH
jgi:hypothetical protein